MENEAPGLQKSLKSRHMTMISLGGVIGAGLFVGSSAVITTTGPASVLSYLMAGLLIVLVMRMLGEMAVANPQVGSFAEYARRSLGGWAGFTTGWLYWYFWAIVLAIEAVAGAEILQRWVDLPLWLMALGLMALLTGINLTSVKSFGEFEFWFAGIKVVAIVAFILIARRLPVRDRRRRLAGPLEPHQQRGLRAPRASCTVLVRRGDRDLRLRGRGDRHDRGRRVRRAGAERHQGGQPGRRCAS